MVDTIPPSTIEKKLEQIWDSLQGTNKMRACLFNLIIYTKKCARNDYLRDISQKVIEKFPSRIIFITHDRQCHESGIRTAASVMTAGEGDSEIVCDLIEVDVCSSHQETIPFVILPHILPDLPIYLVYADDPTEDNPVAQQLEQLADRIIFDSEAACNLPLFAQAVLNHHNSDADIADLNWARTEGWRQLFASVFKSPEELNHLKHATQLTIAYNSKQTDFLCQTTIQSIYLQGWLAVQLGWTLIPDTHASTAFKYQTPTGIVEIVLHPVEADHIAPGRIVSIEIEAPEHYHYSLKRNHTCPNQVIIEKSSSQLCSLPTHYILDKDVSGHSLVKEICHKGTSQHYTRMLALLSTIQQARFHNG